MKTKYMVSIPKARQIGNNWALTLINEAHQAGIREVVEWIDEYSRMTYERDKGEVAFNHVQWHTKLKEWGIE